MTADMFDSNKYEEYLNGWLDGTYDEIKFWDWHMFTKGGIYRKNWEGETIYEKPFKLKDQMPQQGECCFVEIGTGPFPVCGSSNDERIRIYAIDPLAYAYKLLKEKHGIKNRLNPEYGMAERLTDRFDENSVDLILMINSLDHSFSPVSGIESMLRVLKVGGKAILKHMDNEAELEEHKGLHQWNLEVRNDCFYIWRDNYRIDVGERFKEIAEIKTVPAPSNSYHTVEITKKAKFSFPKTEDNENAIFRMTVFNKYLEAIIKKYEMDQKEKLRLDKEKYKDVIGKDVIIFGAGNEGINKLYYLEKVGLVPVAFCDNSPGVWPEGIDGKEVLKPEEAIKKYNSEIFYVSSKIYKNEMISQLEKLGVSRNRIWAD